TLNVTIEEVCDALLEGNVRWSNLKCGISFTSTSSAIFKSGANGQELLQRDLTDSTVMRNRNGEIVDPLGVLMTVIPSEPLQP
ncbi:hypothetical protein Tco_0962069, partial [Tanacetum coccineum]